MTYTLTPEDDRPARSSILIGHSTTVLALTGSITFLFGLIAGAVAGFNAMIQVDAKVQDGWRDGERSDDDRDNL